jgi:phage tail-like protein
VSDLSRSIDVVEYREGTEHETTLALPGATLLSQITLIRPVSDDLSAYDWFDLVATGDIATARVDANLLVFDEAGNVLAEWALTGAWPSALDVRVDGARAAEQVTITVDRLRRIR